MTRTIRTDGTPSAVAVATLYEQAEHAVSVDPEVLRRSLAEAVLEELLPLGSVSRQVDVEQDLAEALVLGVGEVDPDGSPVDRDGQLLVRHMGGADLGSEPDVAQPDRVPAGSEVERSAIEDPVDWADEGAAVGGDRRERQQSHAGKAFA